MNNATNSVIKNFEVCDMRDPSAWTHSFTTAKQVAEFCGCSVGRVYEIAREANSKITGVVSKTTTVKRSFIITAYNREIVAVWNRLN